MIPRMSRWRGPIVALVLVSVLPAVAAEPETAAPAEPTAENRQQMAEVHQKMAECLKSDRPIAECRTQMMHDCREMMGESGCPMMGAGGGGMGPGMGMGMRRGMMKGGPAPEPSPQ